MTKTSPKRDPQAIEPDLAGERKAQWNLMSQRCYLLLFSGIWCYNVAVCCYFLPSAAPYHEILFAATCY